MTPADLITWQLKLHATNKDVSSRLGVTPETYSRWRNGRQPMPHDLQARLAGIEPAMPAYKPKPLPPLGRHEIRPFPRSPTCTLLGVWFDKQAHAALPAGTMYWEYDGRGFLRRRTKAPAGYSDGYDGIFVELHEVGIPAPDQVAQA